MKTSNFKELKVWQRSMDLAVRVYETLKVLPDDEKFCLITQMRRCAVSIPSNVAEGQARNSNNEFYHFLTISRGSNAELQTQLLICQRLNYLSQTIVDELVKELNEIDRMIIGMMNYLKKG